MMDAQSCSQDHVRRELAMTADRSMRRQQSTLTLQSSAMAAAKRGYVDNIIAARGYQKICDRRI